MSNLFGFSTAPKTAADFVPYIKYDARAGRMFRVDRSPTEKVSQQTDITTDPVFKCIADFENAETGWMLFIAGQAPNYSLVPLKPHMTLMHPAPSPEHQNGVRFMLKLSTECAGGTVAVREITSNAKSYVSGIEAVFEQYLAERDANAGKLPVITLIKTVPVKSGSGASMSTNYHPVFAIIGWTPRPADLVYVPKTITPPNGVAVTTVPNTAPSTGSTRASAPQPRPVADIANDFG